MTRHIALFTSLFVIAQGMSWAQAPPQPVQTRGLSPAEIEAASSLILPSPPYCVTWTVAEIAKQVPINFPGLPLDQAFEQTTLVFVPGPEQSPLNVTAVFLWPDNVVDPATGAHPAPIRIHGVPMISPNGSAVWLFNVEPLLQPLHRGTLQFYFESSPGAPYPVITPDVFIENKAWSYFDPRAGPGQIRVGPARPDGSYALSMVGPDVAPIVSAQPGPIPASPPLAPQPPPPVTPQPPPPVTQVQAVPAPSPLPPASQPLPAAEGPPAMSPLPPCRDHHIHH